MGLRRVIRGAGALWTDAQARAAKDAETWDAWLVADEASKVSAERRWQEAANARLASFDASVSAEARDGVAALDNALARSFLSQRARARVDAAALERTFTRLALERSCWGVAVPTAADPLRQPATWRIDEGCVTPTSGMRRRLQRDTAALGRTRALGAWLRRGAARGRDEDADGAPSDTWHGLDGRVGAPRSPRGRDASAGGDGGGGGGGGDGDGGGGDAEPLRWLLDCADDLSTADVFPVALIGGLDATPGAECHLTHLISRSP